MSEPVPHDRDEATGDPGPAALARMVGVRESREMYREHRRRRFRRRGRRAYIRSVYFLPSLATLMNAVCGFGSMYVAALVSEGSAGDDPLTQFFARHHFSVAAYLIFIAMIWDAIDGRLARFTRHTTDFGGQLDSLADVISFGAAPAFLALQVIKAHGLPIPPELTRGIWAIGALYLSCAAMRLARFNVSNEHGEQHHFSFFGLPSPGAGGCVAAFVLMQRHMQGMSAVEGAGAWKWWVAEGLLYSLPVVVLGCGLLMVSSIRYPHLVNRYMRGKASIGKLVFVTAILLVLVVAHQVTMGVGTFVYAVSGPVGYLMGKLRRKGKPAVAGA